jgi:hypothetical protein
MVHVAFAGEYWNPEDDQGAATERDVQVQCVLMN